MTFAWLESMLTMGEMAMPGGWTMSMMWMRMPGATWAGSAASFLAMWTSMMVAMMLPSLTPTLWRYRRRVGAAGASRANGLAALVGVAYFLVWIAVGVVIFPAGALFGTIVMGQPALSRVVPVALGMMVLIAGAVQLTAWKARHLACCRQEPVHGSASSLSATDALRHGLRLGVHCSYSCSGLTMLLLALGVMDFRAMVAVTAAISIERLAPAGDRAARVIGTVAIMAGMFLIVRAAALA